MKSVLGKSLHRLEKKFALKYNLAFTFTFPENFEVYLHTHTHTHLHNIFLISYK